MRSKPKMSVMNYAALLSIFMFAGAGTYEGSAVQSMIEAWPNVAPSTVRLVVTLPSLVCLPAMLIIGGVVGKKISYRTAAILGTALVAVGGAAPFFLSSSWTVIMLCRALLGIGVGILGMRNPLIYASVSKDRQAQFIGYGSVLMTLGNTIAPTAVAFLTRFSWKHSFLYNGAAVIPLIITIFFLKEPAKGDDVAGETVAKENAAASGGNLFSGFTWRTWYYIIFFLAAITAVMPLQTTLASYMSAKEVGTVVIAGTIISAYNLAGTAANMLLAPLMKILKQYLLAFACLCCIIGSTMILLVPSVPTLFIGMIFAGFGFCTILSMVQIYNGSTASAGSVAFASTVILSMLYLGIFASTYFITVSHAIFGRATDAESAYLGCLIVYIVMMVSALVVKVAPEEYYKKGKFKE